MNSRSMRWCICLFLLLAGSAQSQSSGNPGEYTYDMAPSAASLGIGGGSVALTSNTDAMYLNPGLLGTVRYLEASVTYQRLAQEFNWYTIAMTYPFGLFGTAGVMIAGEVAPQAALIDSFGDQHGTYGASDNEVVFSYGKQLHSLLSVGASIKMAYKQMHTYSGMGVGFDLGVASTLTDWLSLGVSMINLGGPTIRLYQKDEAFAAALRAGVGLSFFEKRLRVLGDINVVDLFPDAKEYSGNPNRPIRWQVGVDGNPLPWLGARLGANDRQIAGGIDLSVSTISGEFSLAFPLDASELNLGISYGFSLRWQLGKPMPVQEQDLAVQKRAVDARANLQKAQELYIRGYQLEAKKLIAEYIKVYPDDKEAAALAADINGKLAKGDVADLMEKAKTEYDKRNYTQAETLVTRALVVLPSHEGANTLKQKLRMLKENVKHIESIKTLFTQQKFDEMAKELEVVLSIDSLNSDALEYKGKIADFLKRREADNHYAQASKLYYEQKKIEEANAELQLVLNLMPDHKEAQALHEKISKEVKEIYLKRVGQMVDQKGLAVDNKDLKKLIQMDAQDRLIQIRKFIESRQFARALAEVSAVLKDAPTDAQANKIKAEIEDSLKVEKSDMLYGEALKLFNDGKLADAEVRATEAAAINAANAKAKTLLNDIHLKQRAVNLGEAEKLMAGGTRADLENARKKIDDYLAADAENPKALNLKRDIQTDLFVLDANEYLDKGEYEKADQTIQQALKLNPDSKKVKDAFKNLREAMEALQ